MRRANTRAMLGAVGLLALCSAPSAAAEPTKVVVTIKPLHALVAQVMAGVGVPVLLVKGLASAHTYALRPSEVRALHDADLFVRCPRPWSRSRPGSCDRCPPPWRW